MPSRSICQDCGLCCDGTMYSHVSLQKDDDHNQLAILELRPGQEQEETCFDQPCAAHKGNCCGIYDLRPAICREYRCALLRQIDEGKISAEGGRLLIQDTIALRNRVRPQVLEFVEPGAHASLPRLFGQMTRKLEELSAEERKLVNPKMLLDVGTLRVLLAKRFEPRDTKLAKQAENDTEFIGQNSQDDRNPGGL